MYCTRFSRCAKKEFAGNYCHYEIIREPQKLFYPDEDLYNAEIVLICIITNIINKNV